MNNLEQSDITDESYREYEMLDNNGEKVIYRINNPKNLFFYDGGTTHRVVDDKNIVHCVPAPGVNATILRWKPRDSTKPVKF